MVFFFNFQWSLISWQINNYMQLNFRAQVNQFTHAHTCTRTHANSHTDMKQKNRINYLFIINEIDNERSWIFESNWQFDIDSWQLHHHFTVHIFYRIYELCWIHKLGKFQHISQQKLEHLNDLLKSCCCCCCFCADKFGKRLKYSFDFLILCSAVQWIEQIMPCPYAEQPINYL